jgi:ATP-dependent exoDNAse (exonuclease V) beta subunit
VTPPPPPLDQAIRDRFEREIEKNFSVIAPAGVGKTEAIIRRIIWIATQQSFPLASEWLRHLVVVTYTRRAAREMQQRARNEILSQRATSELLGSFNQAFFGTIHQFCLKLLRIHGHYLGLPASLELLTDEATLSRQFASEIDSLELWLPGDLGECCLRHLSAREIIASARKVRPELPLPANPGPYPNLDLNEILSFVPDKRNVKNVEQGQEIARQWLARFEAGESPLPLPEYSKGGKNFLEAWETAFRPLKRWLGQCTAMAAVGIARAFRQYRLAKGWLTYDDQVSLAAELLDHPEAGPELRKEGLRIVLDEAQDTDPHQFKVLVELARPPEARGPWSDARQHPPRPGHFSMVGDFQQSIYGNRADLNYYRRINDLLRASKEGEELTFHVTFRCNEKIVDFVNGLGVSLLDGREGQVDYVPLTPRPDARPGQVVRWRAKRPEGLEEKIPIERKAAIEATQLAAWIAKQGLEGLRAPCWSEVAVLCPRRRWFNPLARALRKEGLNVQIQSTRDRWGDSPAYAWLTALATIVSEPDNAYEIVGVLREIFGLSDQALADFCEGDERLFEIASPVDPTEPVSETLHRLKAIREKVLRLPLRDAVREIVAGTALFERLECLTDYSSELLQEELEGLLIQAAQAEEEGLTLSQWTERLSEGFLSEREEEPIEEDAIQLLTCQKAKGLQWHAVILPSLYRPIAGPPASYPSVYYRSLDEPPIVAFSGKDVPGELSERIQRAQTQEHRRLLYVAMTRAKETLVFCDSEAIFGEAKNSSFAGLMALDNPKSEALWQSLPGDAAPGLALTVPEAAAKSVPVQVPSALTQEHLARAGKTASAFPRRILPSSLARHHLPEEPELRDDTFDPDRDFGAEALQAAAVDYGSWWHSVMEHLDWKAGKERWEAAFQDRLTTCPNPERASREWKQFLASELIGPLSSEPVIVHTEFPILVSDAKGNILDGLIDLAAWDPVAKRWLVIDWKTDRVEASEVQILIDRYRPQIAAYMAALEKIGGFPVRGVIYSTCTGIALDL